MDGCGESQAVLTQTLYTHSRRSIPTLDHPDQFQYYLTHPRPCIPMSTHFHTSNALHTHQSLQYSSQALHIHLKPLAPISVPLHPTKALHTHIRSSIPILGLNTIPWSFTPTLNPPYQSQALFTHPRSLRLIPDLSYHPRPSKSVPGLLPLPSQPIHTHLRPSITHQRFQYPSQVLQSHL